MKTSKKKISRRQVLLWNSKYFRSMDLVTTIADYLLDYAPRDYHSEEARKALEEANSFMLTLFKLVEDCDREQYNTLVNLIGEYLYADQDKSTKTLEKMWG